MKKPLLLLTVALFFCCAPSQPALFPVEMIVDGAKTEKLELTKTKIKDVRSVGFSVIDSILFCRVFDGSHNFEAYNINTGDLITQFIRRGRGPIESFSVPPLHQILNENSQLKANLTCMNEHKIMKWNISESIKQKRTIIDTVYQFSKEKVNPIYYADYYYQINDKQYITVSCDPDPVYNDMFNFNSKISIVDFKTGEIDRTKTLFDSTVIYDNNMNVSAAGLVKPDNTKMAMIMSSVPQLNIVDIETFEVKGYKLDSKPTQTDKPLVVFTNSTADNEYIYALYIGVEMGPNFMKTDKSSILYVFNWDGQVVKKYDLGEMFYSLWLDKPNNRLYFGENSKGSLYYCSLDDIV